jgi:hypothetical protein
LTVDRLYRKKVIKKKAHNRKLMHDDSNNNTLGTDHMKILKYSYFLENELTGN